QPKISIRCQSFRQSFREARYMAKTAIVVFSGGPDSTAAVLWALAEGYQIELLTFQFKNKEQYGELRSAMKVAELLKVPHTVFDFKSPMQHFRPDVHILMHAGTPAGNTASTKSHLMAFGPGMILETASYYALYFGVYTVI